jgi:multidrug transporter EmrE-like cation transporter
VNNYSLHFSCYIITGNNMTLFSCSQFFILLSCSLAVFCNISQYLCIGRFSATSFQVLGHMKTVCVLLLGWILFDSTLTFKNILGMLLAIVGMVVYSWAVETEKARQKAAMTKTSMTEEEIRLIKEDVVIETKSLKDLELGDSKAYKV